MAGKGKSRSKSSAKTQPKRKVESPADARNAPGAGADNAAAAAGAGPAPEPAQDPAPAGGGSLPPAAETGRQGEGAADAAPHAPDGGAADDKTAAPLVRALIERARVLDSLHVAIDVPLEGRDMLTFVVPIDKVPELEGKQLPVAVDIHESGEAIVFDGLTVSLAQLKAAWEAVNAEKLGPDLEWPIDAPQEGEEGETVAGRFRKKPVEIDAVHFTGDVGAPEIVALDLASEHVEGLGDCLIIPTLEGDHRANPGDWIIRGVKGELYPIKPDIFEATYDPVQPDLPEQAPGRPPTDDELRMIVAGHAAAAVYAGNGQFDGGYLGGRAEAMPAAAAFVRANPTAPANAIPIELRLKGFRDVPQAGLRVMSAWRVFAFTLREIDRLAAEEKALAEAEEKAAQPAPRPTAHADQLALMPSKPALSPTGFSTRR